MFTEAEPLALPAVGSIPPDPAVIALADRVAQAIETGTARPGINRLLPDGSIEFQPFTATPDEWRAGILNLPLAAADALRRVLGSPAAGRFEAQTEGGA